MTEDMDQNACDIVANQDTEHIEVVEIGISKH
jgi:hypothetical protein